MNIQRIEFKVWDRENNKMYMPKDICAIYTLITPHGILTKDNEKLFHFVLCLFIGRYDKNKKKIYYGDIFQVIPELFAYVDWFPKESKYGLNFNDSMITNPDAYFDQLEGAEIQGNIFENPNTIKGIQL